MKRFAQWVPVGFASKIDLSALASFRHVLAAFAMAVGLANPAHAQSSLPTFTCEADAYNVFGSPTNLQRFDPATRSVLSSIPVSPAIEINGIGYNVLDNYIYGLANDPLGVPGFANDEFVRVGVNGAVEALGFPAPATAGLPAFNPIGFSGVMDASGNWYGISTNNIFIVNIGNNPAAGTLTYTTIARSGFTGNLADMAFSPFDGALYGTGGNVLQRIDLATGNGAAVTTAGDPALNAGGAWSISDGTVFFYRNNNNSPALISVDLSQPTPVVTNLGPVPSNSQFDSAACLPPLLTKTVVSPPDANGEFPYEFTITNAFVNPISLDFSDPLPAELEFVAGSLSLTAPGGGTVTTFTGSNLDISNINIPAAGSVTFQVRVRIRQGTPAGTTIVNQATLSFGGATIPSDNPTTGPSNDPTPITAPTPSLTISKPAPTNADEDASGSVTVGDTLTYTITATNSGSTTLTNVVVSDLLLDTPNTQTCASVPSGGTCVLTGTHTVTTPEANANMVDNTASVQSDTVTVPVQVTRSTAVTPVINAQADDFSATPVAAGDNTPTVFTGDTLNGGSFAPAGVTPSILNDGGLTGVVINADGTLTVPASAVAGTFTVTYQICDATDAALCSDATVTIAVGTAAAFTIVKPAPTNADEDGSGTVTAGDTLTYTITATNDGNAPQTNVVVSDPLLDAPNTQTCASVPAGGTCVLTGTHTVTTPEADAGMVDNTASVQSDQVTTPVTVMRSTSVAPSIDAQADDFSATPVAAGGNTPTVFTGDTLNGGSFAPADVTPSILNDGGLTGVTINADGTLTVPANAPAGPFTITYQICDATDAALCSDATVMITVAAAPNLTIVKPAPTNADEDGSGTVTAGDTLTYTITATNDGNAPQTNVVVSDPLLDAPNTQTCVTVAIGSTCVLTGTHTVTTPEADTSMVDNTASVQSDQVTTPVTVMRSTPVAPSIDAQADDFSATPVAAGGNTPTVFTGDALNGGSFARADVTPSILNDGGLTGVTINPDGTLTIPANAPAGPVTMTYQICDATDAALCSNATVMVTVAAAPNLSIVKPAPTNADEDSSGTVTAGDTLTYTITATNDGNALQTNVVVSDPLLDAPNTQTCATVAIGGTCVLTGTHTVTTPEANAGMLDNTASVQSDQVTTPVTVMRSTSVAPSIDAQADDFSATPVAAGGNTPTVFTGDTLNGGSFVPADVTPSILNDGGLTGVTINADGTLTIPANAPAGPFTITYQICDATDAALCSDATVMVTVAAAPNLTIIKPEPTNADEDGSGTVTAGDTLTYTITATNDGNAPQTNVVVSDPLLDAPNTQTCATVAIGGTCVLTGTHTVTSPEANAGMLDNTASVQSDQVTTPVTVMRSTTTSVNMLTAGTETYPPVNGATGGALPSVLGADMLNNAPVDPADVSLTIDSVLDPTGNVTTAITVNPDGTITVPAGTPAGDYSVTYTICEVTNPGNCSSVTETVSVGAAPSLSLVKPAPINADEDGSGSVTVGDTLTYIITATNTGNAPQTNITVSDAQITPSLQTCVSVPIGGTCVLTGTHIVTADETNAGVINNTAGVISDEVPTPVEITQSTSVDLNTLVAGGDSFAGTPLTSGEPGTTPSVFGNDTLGGNPIDPTGLITTLTDTGGLTGAALNPDGTISIPADVPAGTYTLEYQICEIANPTNCATGTITIIVEAMQIDAVPDDFSATPVPSGGATPSLLSDDTLNSGGFNPSEVVLTLKDNGGLSGVSVNADGTLNIPVDTQPGTFVIEYEICDILNPTNCDTATATMIIEPPAQLFATKVANTSTASTGGIVAYTITMRNDGGTVATDVEIVDTPPLGFRYVEGSGIVNGAAVEPVISGAQLSWTNIDIPAGETATVNLALIVGSGVNVGDFANTAFAETTPGTVRLSNEAQAIVRITPDEVFDCSEVIGKVFEDIDGDGYQDEGEPGIPGARVATATGLLITADEFGRYHIACAATPKQGIGSNFIVKLDTRSLPSGFEVTTENPRVVRLTEGKLTSADFGVSRLRSVTLDLLPSAFITGTTELKANYAEALGETLRTLREEPSVLTLSYEGADGTARLDALANSIREAWGEGPYVLEIRTRTVSGTDREER